MTGKGLRWLAEHRARVAVFTLKPKRPRFLYPLWRGGLTCFAVNPVSKKRFEFCPHFVPVALTTVHAVRQRAYRPADMGGRVYDEEQLHRVT